MVQAEAADRLDVLYWTHGLKYIMLSLLSEPIIMLFCIPTTYSEFFNAVAKI